MDPGTTTLLALLVLLVALLYSSVGHGGGSGYLAMMALVGLAPELMKPTALSLNILVASIGTWQFYRAGCFSWSLFWPFAVTSVPFAYLGGTFTLPPYIYRPLLGFALLFASYSLIRRQARLAAQERKRIPHAVALVAGAVIGLLSGLTGIGGGVYLSPLLLLSGWAEPRIASGIAAGFILVNSIAGLAGHVSFVAAPPSFLPMLALAAGVGGLIGARIGSRVASPRVILRLLAAVLLIAGLKMLFT